MDTRKKIATLRQIVSGNNLTLTAVYFDKRSGKNVIWEETSEKPKEVTPKEMALSRPFMYPMTVDNGYALPIEVSDILTSSEVKKAENFCNFWLKHNKVAHALNPTNRKASTGDNAADLKWNEKFYNPNLVGNADFVLEQIEDIRNERTDELNKKIDAINICKDFDFEEKKNVCYFFNEVPNEEDEDALTLRLMNFSNGLILQTENLDKFINNFGTGEHTSNTTLSIIANKAVLFRRKSGETIVQERGGKYYYGADIIADGYDSYLLYLKNNKNVFDIISNEIYARQDKNKETAKKIKELVK